MTKLLNHPHSKCGVIVTPDELTFYSYSTAVISVTNGKNGERIFSCSGTYSQTTRRQITWFLREYFPDLNYYDMKNIVGKGKVIL